MPFWLLEGRQQTLQGAALKGLVNPCAYFPEFCSFHCETGQPPSPPTHTQEQLLTLKRSADFKLAVHPGTVGEGQVLGAGQRQVLAVRDVHLPVRAEEKRRHTRLVQHLTYRTQNCSEMRMWFQTPLFLTYYLLHIFPQGNARWWCQLVCLPIRHPFCISLSLSLLTISLQKARQWSDS